MATDDKSKSEKEKPLNPVLKIIFAVFSFLGASGNAVQGFMGLKDLLSPLVHAIKMAFMIGHHVSAALQFFLNVLGYIPSFLGSLCSGTVNLVINFELLENFFRRFRKTNTVKLTPWQKFRKYAGVGIFVATGILFGATTFAFGLGVVGIIAGLFVAGIMIIQEVETWLESFDKASNQSLWMKFLEWKKDLTAGKRLGLVIASGNVLALSLLFTFGLVVLATHFLALPLLPVLIASTVIAFTVGGFTEFYFYNRFLSGFCDNLKASFAALKAQRLWGVGFAVASINALMMGAGTYVGITLFAAAIVSVIAPPVGIVIGVAITAAIFATAASFILGVDFWTKNVAKFSRFFGSKKSEPIENNDSEVSQKQNSTKTILQQTPISILENVPQSAPKTANDPPQAKEEKAGSLPIPRTPLQICSLYAGEPLNDPDISSPLLAQSL